MNNDRNDGGIKTIANSRCKTGNVGKVIGLPITKIKLSLLFIYAYDTRHDSYNKLFKFKFNDILIGSYIEYKIK